VAVSQIHVMIDYLKCFKGCRAESRQDSAV
jgi:hypothetical protein